MQKKFTIACRGSKLSLVQAEIFKRHVLKKFPKTDFQVKIIRTRGDMNPDRPLETLGGKDFFTSEVQQALDNGTADFAIHSMKDISSLSFFRGNRTAVFNRGLIHDVAIFNEDIVNRLGHGERIRIGTSSPRRTRLGIKFLNKALPRIRDQEPLLEVKPIRGNVDTRLQKLDQGDYDGIILAIEGINRLIKYSDASEELRNLLDRKKIMVLSLFSAPPAPNQAALVAETQKENVEACRILEQINHDDLSGQTLAEREVALKFGQEGCSQHFGVFSSTVRDIPFTYATGFDEDEKEFTHWDHQEPQHIQPNEVLYFKEVLKQAFTYHTVPVSDSELSEDTIFITHRKTIHEEWDLDLLKSKAVWTSGVDTWIFLAKRGIWVEGCVDGLGLQGINRIWENSFLQHRLCDTLILTNAKSKAHYTNQENVLACYDLKPTYNPEVIEALRQAKGVFWTSYQQFLNYSSYTHVDAHHLCAAGRTAQLIKAQTDPIIFPTIKAFKQWKNIL